MGAQRGPQGTDLSGGPRAGSRHGSGFGNTTEGNPLGSGGAMEILQKGICWGAVTGMGLELAGEPGGAKGAGRKNFLMLTVFSLKPSLLGHLGTPR